MQTENIIHGSYGRLLFDQRWRNKRQEILYRDNNCCVICGSSEKLQVHHKQYHVQNGKKFVPWSYDNKYLITVCESCHKRGHAKYDVPVFEIFDRK